MISGEPALAVTRQRARRRLARQGGLALRRSVKAQTDREMVIQKSCEEGSRKIYAEDVALRCPDDPNLGVSSGAKVSETSFETACPPTPSTALECARPRLVGKEPVVLDLDTFPRRCSHLGSEEN